jgi:hypothetical protein
MDIDPHSLIPHLSPYFRPPAEFNHSGFSGGQFPPKVNNKKKDPGRTIAVYLSVQGDVSIFSWILKISIAPFGEFWNVTNGSKFVVYL